MKVRSDRLPQNDFEINNIQGNICDVVFFDVSNLLEEKDENNNISYEYDAYTIKNTSYRTNLGTDISENYDKWYNYAIQYEKDVLMAEIRAKRNELLKDTDKEVALDRLGIEFPDIEFPELDPPKELSISNYLSYLKDLGNSFATIIKLIKPLIQALTNKKYVDMVLYRQKLRDITKESNNPNFPYNVIFPKNPNEDSTEE